MSKGPELAAATEIAITFGGFKNIDLFSQGIYQVRLRATNERSKRPCLPFTFDEGTASMPPPPSDGSYLPAHTLNDTSEFCMPAFRVRYCEQEVQMSTVVRLRTDLMVEAIQSVRAGRTADAPLGLSALEHAGAGDLQPVLEPVLLEVRLLHARSSTVLDAAADAAKQSRTHFKPVAVQTLRLCVPVRGGSAFFPVTFDEWHFCYAPLLVHAAVVGSKLVSPPRPARARAAVARASVAPAPMSPSKLVSRLWGSAASVRRSDGGRGGRDTAGGGEPARPLLEEWADRPGWFKRGSAQAAAAAAAAAPNAALAQLLGLALSPPAEPVLRVARANAAVARVAVTALTAHVRRLIWTHAMFVARCRQMKNTGGGTGGRVRAAAGGAAGGVEGGEAGGAASGGVAATAHAPGTGRGSEVEATESCASLSRASLDEPGARAGGAVGDAVGGMWALSDLLPPHLPSSVEILLPAAARSPAAGEDGVPSSVGNASHLAASSSLSVEVGDVADGTKTAAAAGGVQASLPRTADEAVSLDSSIDVRIDTRLAGDADENVQRGKAGGVPARHEPSGREELIHRTARMGGRRLPAAALLEQASEAADAIAAMVRLRLGDRIAGLWSAGGAAGGATPNEYISGLDAVMLGREALGLLSGLSGQVPFYGCWCCPCGRVGRARFVFGSPELAPPALSQFGARWG